MFPASELRWRIERPSNCYIAAYCRILHVLDVPVILSDTIETQMKDLCIGAAATCACSDPHYAPCSVWRSSTLFSNFSLRIDRDDALNMLEQEHVIIVRRSRFDEVVVLRGSDPTILAHVRQEIFCHVADRAWTPAITARFTDPPAA
jgi:hypothetical protein